VGGHDEEKFGELVQQGGETEKSKRDEEKNNSQRKSFDRKENKILMSQGGNGLKKSRYRSISAGTRGEYYRC